MKTQASLNPENIPYFSPGDTVNVAVEITEGSNKRVQNYAGVVIKRQGEGSTKTFTAFPGD